MEKWRNGVTHILKCGKRYDIKIHFLEVKLEGEILKKDLFNTPMSFAIAANLSCISDY
jgi:hypothetical protein